ncbi:hypothetical protein MLD38_014589 [Melastoma candidum]|uniref:Uncharacterized protein n=1 Tax=Melastoma candidum TaxID=119954 RepID=A0ACB9RGD8_9MYRT|nr:hypothetical protein MLD38_014589 [Melastoma candidum]
MTFAMSSLVILTGVVFLVVWLHHNSVPVQSQSSGGVPAGDVSRTVFINGTVVIATTYEDFICATLDWWPPDKCDYGTCSWGSSTLLTLDLKNEILLNAVKAFSPLRIRMGGTLQDKVVYQSQDDQSPCDMFVKNGSEFLGFSRGCLPMSRWDELNSFFKDSGAIVTFGLNALYGRSIGSDGLVAGPWDSSNAQSLLRYTVNKGYSIMGWELGNELSGSGVGARVSADQYASDISTLQNLVETEYTGFESKPLILAPGGFFDAEWFGKFVDQANGTLQVITHHIYNLGPGVDDHLVDKILNPSYLDGARQNFQSLQTMLKNSGSSAVAWVGEAGGAYNSGRNLVTNSFIFSFWYLDQLGMASIYNTKTYCRQSLIGGNYGLLNTSTFQPNPDYYSALLWHRLMGSTVLDASFSGTDKLRTYAHCSKNAPGITLLLINLDGNSTIEVQVSTAEYTRSDELSLQQHSQTGGTDFAKMSRRHSSHASTREEYHLTPDGGDLHSQTMLLNGKILQVDRSGKIPQMDPVKVRESDPISVAPYSIVFARIANQNISACT